MRVCSACSRENPDDRDFCECGEYLRWDPTGVVQAITPEVLQAAQEQAPPAAQSPPAQAPPAQPQQPAAQPAQPAQPQPPQAPPAHPQASPAPPQTPASPANGAGAPVVSGDPLAGPPPPPAAPAPPAPTAQPPAAQQPPRTPTLQQPAAPAPPPQQPAEPDPAAITLRLPEGDHGDLGQTLAVGVDPGGRARVVALVRNQSGIVDNYELSVRGLPGDWYSIFPATVYLVPFGTSGTYEQEVEIHLHPPRSAEAEARIWELEVVGESKAYQRQAAAAPLKLGIQPYEEFKTKLSPERASGRKKAQYDVAVKNTANAPVTVALDAADQDNELAYNFSPATLEIPPGGSHTSKMLVKPPRQRWIGRPEEKRIQVFTKTGEEANQAKSAADMELPEGYEAEEEGGEGAGAAAKGAGKGFLKRFRVTGPRAQVGTSGVRMSGPRVAKPAVPSKNVDLMKLKAPGGGVAMPQMPLMPNQVVFRHKAWLPWWIALLVPLLLLLALLLFLFLPRNVTVPEVTGAPSAFEAEQKLVKADLKLAPAPKEKVSTEAPPGTVIGQTPAAGEKAEKDSEVTVEIAVGNGKVQVPNVVGQNQAEAEKTLREKNLTIGQLQPQPPDPKAKISSQIPAAEEVVTEGKPIDLFMETIKDKKQGGDKKDEDGGGGGGGGGKAAAVTLPALVGLPVAEAAQKAADAGLVPEKVTEFSGKKKGDLIRTEPGPGTELKAGDKVKLVVSGGFPQLTYDDGKNVLLANGANGKRLPAVAKGSQTEKDPTFSADGTKIAFLSDRRVFMKDLSKPDEPPVPLTAPGEKFSDPAWAPTVDSNVLAVFKDKTPGAIDVEPTDQDLCLLKVSKDLPAPQCISEPDFNVIKVARWAPDGKSILALGVKEPGTFGMVRWTSKTPFSAERDDWSKGRFKTDTNIKDKGVIDMSISPDGKQMMAVANFDSPAFQLYLAKPKDTLLVDAKPLGVQACKVAWRSDGVDVVVVQADEGCTQGNGQIVRVPVKNPSAQQRLAFIGDNPAFQPLTLE